VGNKVALTAYRLLARQTLRQFIYHRVGYDRGSQVARCWREYQNRLLLNRPRRGYFTTFNQTADLVVTSIYEGLEVDDHTVPDISVGQTWARYWGQSKLDEQFGQRIPHLHWYPDNYPQSRVNPLETWAYPNAAWEEFQDWLHRVYLPAKFPIYVRRKVKQGALPAERADSLLAVTGAHVAHGASLVGEPKAVCPALPEPVERPGRRVS